MSQPSPAQEQHQPPAPTPLNHQPCSPHTRSFRCHCHCHPDLLASHLDWVQSSTPRRPPDCPGTWASEVGILHDQHNLAHALHPPSRPFPLPLTLSVSPPSLSLSPSRHHRRSLDSSPLSIKSSVARSSPSFFQAATPHSITSLPLRLRLSTISSSWVSRCRGRLPLLLLTQQPDSWPTQGASTVRPSRLGHARFLIDDIETRAQPTVDASSWSIRTIVWTRRPRLDI